MLAQKTKNQIPPITMRANSQGGKIILLGIWFSILVSAFTLPASHRLTLIKPRMETPMNETLAISITGKLIGLLDSLLEKGADSESQFPPSGKLPVGQLPLDL